MKIQKGRQEVRIAGIIIKQLVFFYYYFIFLKSYCNNCIEVFGKNVCLFIFIKDHHCP